MENKMGTMPMPKLMIKMSLPIMISMLVQALYNIVDSMFVARLSQDALAAVSLCYPVQTIMIAIACGTGLDLIPYYQDVWVKEIQIKPIRSFYMV